MPFTKRISIERYKGDLAESAQCAGLIEGETEDGQRWIIFMDAVGRPQIYWPQRDEGGGVIGEGIPLDQGELGAIKRNLKLADDEELISCFPIWQFSNEAPASADYGMRGIVFAVVPGEGTLDEKMRRFTQALAHGWEPRELTPLPEEFRAPEPPGPHTFYPEA